MSLLNHLHWGSQSAEGWQFLLLCTFSLCCTARTPQLFPSKLCRDKEDGGVISHPTQELALLQTQILFLFKLFITVFSSSLNFTASFTILPTDTSENWRKVCWHLNQLLSCLIVTSSGMVITSKSKHNWEHCDDLWQRGGGCANSVQSWFLGWTKQVSYVQISPQDWISARGLNWVLSWRSNPTCFRVFFKSFLQYLASVLH